MFTSFVDRRTDRQTERQTDGQTPAPYHNKSRQVGRIIKRDGTRCRLELAFPASMGHPLLMLHENHLFFRAGQARYQGKETDEKTYRWESHCDWSRIRISFNIPER